MSREPGLHSRASSSRATSPSEPWLPVLIQVPYLPEQDRRAGSRRDAAEAEAYRPGRSGRVATRRRLRREVRLTAYALLAALPVGFLALGFWGGRQSALGPHRSGGSAGAEPSAALARANRPPAVSISIEPAGSSHSHSHSHPHPPRVESAPPVVLPGYLLPDDGTEEPAHAGS